MADSRGGQDKGGGQCLHNKRGPQLHEAARGRNKRQKAKGGNANGHCHLCCVRAAKPQPVYAEGDSNRTQQGGGVHITSDKVDAGVQNTRHIKLTPHECRWPAWGGSNVPFQVASTISITPIFVSNAPCSRKAFRTKKVAVGAMFCSPTLHAPNVQVTRRLHKQNKRNPAILFYYCGGSLLVDKLRQTSSVFSQFNRKCTKMH